MIETFNTEIVLKQKAFLSAECLLSFKLYQNKLKIMQSRMQEQTEVERV